jgi:REP-associated tyrosine transposase
MPRKCRYAPVDICSHVVNRGNDKKRIFFSDRDYELFLELLAYAKRRYAVSVFGVCLMPNHFHAMICPRKEGALSAYLQWVTGLYAMDLRARTDTLGHGHVFQRRFWNACVYDNQFLPVLRYIEANPLRAKLVEQPGDCRWSSFVLRQKDGNDLLDPLPTTLPDNWATLLTTDQAYAELDKIRTPLRPGRPGPLDRRS